MELLLYLDILHMRFSFYLAKVVVQLKQDFLLDLGQIFLQLQYGEIGKKFLPQF